MFSFLFNALAFIVKIPFLILLHPFVTLILMAAVIYGLYRFAKKPDAPAQVTATTTKS